MVGEANNTQKGKSGRGMQLSSQAETSTAYEGYNALFGHKYVTQALRTLGLNSNVLDANGNLKDLDGNTIVDDFPAGTLTPGSPGFSP